MLCSMTSNATPRRLISTMRSRITSRRLGLTPAAGSSSRSSDGSAISARASSSNLRSPPERIRAGSRASRSSLTKARRSIALSRQARSSRATSRGAIQFGQMRSPVCRWAPSITFSISVIPGNGRGIWKVRPRPCASRESGGADSTATPSSQIRPEVGFSSPAIRLKSVVFPAPLGPISPTISPGPTSIVTSSTAATPPKRLISDFADKAGRSPLAGFFGIGSIA
jgi:hypothetical protein